jgi:hypothetical protein
MIFLSAREKGNTMWSYFDLNKRAHRSLLEELVDRQISTAKIIEPEPEVAEEEKPKARVHLSPLLQIIMYFGIFIGIFFSTAVNQFKKEGAFNLAISVPTILISAVIALVLIPIVYEKLNLNPGSPFIVQFGLFVQHGVFWHVIFGAIGESIKL